MIVRVLRVKNDRSENIGRTLLIIFLQIEPRINGISEGEDKQTIVSSGLGMSLLSCSTSLCSASPSIVDDNVFPSLCLEVVAFAFRTK